MDAFSGVIVWAGPNGVYCIGLLDFSYVPAAASQLLHVKPLAYPSAMKNRLRGWLGGGEREQRLRILTASILASIVSLSLVGCGKAEEEKKIAEEFIKIVNDSGRWQYPVVTTLEPLAVFYQAEEYHQDYLQKNPGGYNCHYVRGEKYI